MDKRDRFEGRSEQAGGARESQSAPRVAPGKVTQTSKLGSGGGPVQRKMAAPGGAAPGPARAARESSMDRWMDAAHRGATALADTGHDAVQARGNVQSEDPAAVHSAAAAGVSGGGGALPYLDRIQASFGAHDLGGVQAHVGGAASAASEQIGAQAYATGNHIAFGSQPDLHTVAHEAAHVVQQRAGVQLSGGVGRAGDTYEQQADRVADRVVKGESAEDLLGPAAGAGSASSVQSKAVQRYAVEKVNGTNALVAEDKQAIKMGQQKLYATDARIGEGNAKLNGVGQHGSFIQLGKGKATLDYDGKTLHSVKPTWVNKGANSGYHGKVNDANKSGGKDTEGNTGGDMALWTDCGRSSGAVTGSVGGDRQVVYNKNGKEVVTNGTVDSSITKYRDGTPNQMANKVYMDLIPGFIKDPANDKFLKSGVHYTGSDAAKVHKTPATILEAKLMYAALTPDGKDKFDRTAGINHYANPGIGEAYTMATEAQMPGFKKAGDMTWNFHWAGVIMKSGSDNVTLENFAVTEETAKDAGVAQGDYIDRAWNFDMYGTTDKSQTFHKKHLDTGTHGTHATSLTSRTKK
jgi:hypothetical protein